MAKFNKFQIEVSSIEGGNVIRAQMLLDDQITDSTEIIIPGKTGTPVLSSRTRKRVKALFENAYPKPIKVVAENPDQIPLAGTV